MEIKNDTDKFMAVIRQLHTGPLRDLVSHARKSRARRKLLRRLDCSGWLGHLIALLIGAVVFRQ
jgi:hypothetical protein